MPGKQVRISPKLYEELCPLARERGITVGKLLEEAYRQYQEMKENAWLIRPPTGMESVIRDEVRRIMANVGIEVGTGDHPGTVGGQPDLGADTIT